MPQASGRMIHGNLRPKDNDEGINKDWIYTTYNEQLELESGFRISHSRLNMPQRVTPSSARLKGILVISNFILFLYL